MKQNWLIKKIDAEKVSQVSKELGIESHLAYILNGKGFSDIKDIEEFLHPQLSDMYSPFLMNGIYEAIDRIKAAISNGETIGIFSDSDLDGMTSLFTLYSLLIKMTDKIYVRHLQDDELYGITEKIIDDFKDNGVHLLITVDSGTRDIHEIKYAKEKGIDVIVTDHHEQDIILPDSIIVNPKVHTCQYPFKDLAGVGVTFKLSLAILYSYLPIFNTYTIFITLEDELFSYSIVKNGIIDNKKEKITKDEMINSLHELNLKSTIVCDNDLDFVNDIEDINNINNTYQILPFINLITGKSFNSIELFCKAYKIRDTRSSSVLELYQKIFFELQLISSKKISSFIHSVLGFVSLGSIADVMPLIDENRVLVKKGIELLNFTTHTGLSILLHNNSINSKKIGWEIAPLLNTPGRFGKTALTFNFFMEQDYNKVQGIIEEIKTLNQERKDQVTKIYNEIMDSLEKIESQFKNIYIIKSDKIHEGIAGLIANRISTSTFKPAIVIALPGEEGIVKGSGRSNIDINLFQYLEPLKERFERIGGHDNAFGFTIKIEDLDSVMIDLDRALDNKDNDQEIINIDMELNLNEINIKFIKSLNPLEPFGKSNEEPFFISKQIKIESLKPFGNGKHGRCTFSVNKKLTAVGWNMIEELDRHFTEDKPLDIIYTVELNEFLGKVGPRIILKDISFS